MVIFLPKLWVTATQLGWVTRLPRKRVVHRAPSGWVKLYPSWVKFYPTVLTVWVNTFNSGFSFIFLDLDSAGLYILENTCFEARALKVVAIIIQDKGTILIFQERG